MHFSHAAVHVPTETLHSPSAVLLAQPGLGIRTGVLETAESTAVDAVVEFGIEIAEVVLKEEDFALLVLLQLALGDSWGGVVERILDCLLLPAGSAREDVHASPVDIIRLI